MNYIDYIIIIVLAVGFILGFKDGLVRKIIGLLGLVIAIGLAIKFSPALGETLAPAFNNELYLSKILSGVLIFLVVVFIVSVLKRVIHPSDKVNKLVNQLLGGISGTIQLLFFLSAVLLFANIFNFPSQKDKDDSYLYSKVYSVIPFTLNIIVGSDFKAEGFIKDYIDSKNNMDDEIFNDSTNTE